MNLSSHLGDALQDAPCAVLDRCEALVARMQVPEGAMPDVDAARRSLVIMLSRGVLDAAGVAYDGDPTLEEALQIRMAVIMARRRFREMAAGAAGGFLAARMQFQE